MLSNVGDVIEWTLAALAVFASSADAGTAKVGCSVRAEPAPPVAVSPTDAVLGPLALVGGRAWVRKRPDAFNRQGYKIPATLLDGERATLRVPSSMRGRVGLVFTHAAQDRVFERGVRGADRAVTFTACPAGDEPSRTAWAGGLVVDRRRCATLTLHREGRPSIRRRLPLGRPCPR